MVRVLSKRGGAEVPPEAVLVDRTTPWGNPYVLSAKVNRTEAVRNYTWFLAHSDDERAVWMRAHAHELEGLDLVCWCAPLECHADVLARYVDWVCNA